MSAVLSNFESDLMRLLIVALRFQAIYFEFPNQMKSTREAQLVRAMLREYAIIQLHNFFKIREDLLTHPDFKKLDDVIKPLIQPILAHKNGIKQMRHNYVAHIQEKGRRFRIMMNDIVIRYNLPTNWASWRYFVGLAWFYYGVVDNNFEKEMERANRKYDAKVGIPIKTTLGFQMKDVQLKISQILKPVTMDLDNRGFKTTLKPEELAKLKKQYSSL